LDFVEKDMRAPCYVDDKIQNTRNQVLKNTGKEEILDTPICEQLRKVSTIFKTVLLG
jgi:hypothetical protein